MCSFVKAIISSRRFEFTYLTFNLLIIKKLIFDKGMHKFDHTTHSLSMILLEIRCAIKLKIIQITTILKQCKISMTYNWKEHVGF